MIRTPLPNMGVRNLGVLFDKYNPATRNGSFANWDPSCGIPSNEFSFLEKNPTPHLLRWGSKHLELAESFGVYYPTVTVGNLRKTINNFVRLLY